MITLNYANSMERRVLIMLNIKYNIEIAIDNYLLALIVSSISAAFHLCSVFCQVTLLTGCIKSQEAAKSLMTLLQAKGRQKAYLNRTVIASKLFLSVSNANEHPLNQIEMKDIEIG